MNYLEWSQEYVDTAEKLGEIILKLRKQRRNSSLSRKKEIDAKLRQYRTCYGECMEIANHLKKRHREAA